MDQLFPVIFVIAMIAFILIRQIKHITGNLEIQNDANYFDKYSKFSVTIQNHIRAIKLDIDSTKKIENPRYILLENINEEESIELLSDYLRKLVFFETLLAKKKTASEIESELFSILSQVDTFIKERCLDGELLANELRENLLEEYEG